MSQFHQGILDQVLLLIASFIQINYCQLFQAILSFLEAFLERMIEAI